MDGVVLALVLVVAARPQRPHDLDRLLEHLVPDVSRRPATADDVLVEVLARPDPEAETPGAHRCDRCRLLGHDRRVVADGRTRDERNQLDIGRLRRERAEHAPGIRTVVLRMEPGVKVVGDRDEVEPSLLGARGLRKELVRAM
jgi:hypothetical protein